MTQVLMENQESASGNLASHQVFVFMASSAEFHMLLEAYGWRLNLFPQFFVFLWYFSTDLLSVYGFKSVRPGLKARLWGIYTPIIHRLNAPRPPVIKNITDNQI